jgi:hypothetical protein
MDELVQRRELFLDHIPGAIWAHWRRSLKTEIAAPTWRHVVKGLAAKGHGHAIQWNGDAIRHAASAICEVYFYVMARCA